MVVLMPNCTFLSEVSRMIEIHKALFKINVPSLIATHGGTYEFIFEQEKLKYDTLSPVFTKETSLKYLEIVRDGGRKKMFTSEEIIEQVKNEVAYLRRVKATAVISGFTLSARLSSSVCNIPLFVTHLGSFVPITVEKGMFSFYECFHNAFTDKLPRKWIDNLGKLVLMILKGPIEPYITAAKYFKIEPVLGMVDLLMGDYTLITDVPEILQISETELHEWNPSRNKICRPDAKLAYVGPIFANLFGEVSHHVLNFLNTEKPKIYVSMNSGKKSDLELVIRSFEGMDVKVLVCSTVHQVSFKKLEQILIADFLPSPQIMPLCDLAIINGGQGTVQTAINSGVPIIGFPLQPEQNFNLMQVQKHGAGICMSLYDLRRGKLKTKITEVLQNLDYKTKMGRLKDWQSQRDGAVETAKLVQQTIG